MAYDPAVPLLGIYQENYNLKRYIHHSAHYSTTYKTQDMKATSISINRGMNKKVAHIYNGILLSHKMRMK